VAGDAGHAAQRVCGAQLEGLMWGLDSEVEVAGDAGHAAQRVCGAQLEGLM